MPIRPIEKASPQARARRHRHACKTKQGGRSADDRLAALRLDAPPRGLRFAIRREHRLGRSVRVLLVQTEPLFLPEHPKPPR
jgi:hypothetical protein